MEQINYEILLKEDTPVIFKKEGFEWTDTERAEFQDYSFTLP